MSQNYRFFNHRECEYYPCHSMKPEEMNCLFCFCPLYCLGRDCGGNYRYTDGGMKDCSECILPHRKENYEYLMEQLAKIAKVG